MSNLDSGLRLLYLLSWRGWWVGGGAGLGVREIGSAFFGCYYNQLLFMGLGKH